MRRTWILSIVLVACGGSETRPVEPKPVAAMDAAVEGGPQARPEPVPPGLRLPETVAPTAYELELQLDADKETFAGEVAIDLAMTEASDVVWLHASDLEIASATIDGAKVAAILPGKEEMLGLRVAEPLAAGAHRVEITFTGKVPKNQLMGLFRQQDGGRWYLYSQFEATAARKAFPCFDEPRFKVPWTVTLVVPDGQGAYGNAPAVSDTPDGAGKHVVTFAPTPPIPSYLVAVAVGPFDVVDLGTVGRNQVPARVLTPKGRADEAATAKQQIPKIVTALEDYFDMPLPFDKLDSVAVPGFFGAMENPGLVTYDDGILLAPPARAGERFRMTLTSIAGHEIAHQWFGNYVTLAWWDDLWLNESFATWMADKVAMTLEPSWDRAVRAVSTANRAMDADGRLTAHPLRRPITGSADIEGAFDAISYDKGGAVLTMFESWIGADKFRDGVRAYMKAHARGSATAVDFIGALEAASNAEVGTAFRAYLEQPGVPVVHAELTCAKGAPARVRLAQRRLVGFGEQAPADLWPVRACVRWGGRKGGTACTSFDTAEATLELDAAAGCPTWLVGNADAAGYYRVAYSDDLAARLQKHLRQVPAVERLAFAADLVALLEAGTVSADDALAPVGALLATRDEHDLASAVDLVASTERLVSDDLLPTWRTWVIARLGKLARAAALQPPADETGAEHEARVALLDLVGVYARDARLAAAAGKRLAPWLAGKADAPRDLRLLVALAARGGDAKLFDAMLAMAKKTDDRDERGELLAGLGYFTDPALVERAHQVVLGGEFDVFEIGAVLQAQLESSDGARAVAAFIRTNWDALVANLPRIAQPYLVYMQGRVCDADGRTELDTFVAARADQISGGARALAETLAGVDACIARRAALSGDLAAIIKAKAGPRSAR
jgi:alanyl aminopeptidase